MTELDLPGLVRRVGARRDAPPPLPELAELPPTPAELRPGEDAVTRFGAELGAVGGVLEQVAEPDLADRIAAILEAEGCYRVAVADDLGARRDALDGRLGAVRYTDVAGDRAAVGALDATVTGCAAAIAATGSIVTSASAGRASALIAPVHVCVLERDRLVDGLTAFLARSRELGGGSMLALQSGPSRSADIEKTLILGVHGPRATYVLLVEAP